MVHRSLTSPSTRDTANAGRTTGQADYGQCLPSLGWSYSFDCCRRSLPSTPLPGLCFFIRLGNADLDRTSPPENALGTMPGPIAVPMNQQALWAKTSNVRSNTCSDATSTGHSRTPGELRGRVLCDGLLLMTLGIAWHASARFICVDICE